MQDIIKSLNEIYKSDKHNRTDDLNLRLHRALSWLKKANDCQDDLDVCFVSLWIGFNAVYAKEMGMRTADRTDFIDFLNVLCRLDDDQKLYQLICKQFSQAIRVMLNNRYVFQKFWDCQNGKIDQSTWEEDFKKSNNKAFQALLDKDTHSVMVVIFDRLYTLRNQIVHGGATYGSSVNRNQLSDACKILLSVIPVIIEIILNHSEYDWGKPFYPVVD